MVESSASPGIAVRSCLRHGDYRGDHFCVGCGGALCRPCAKSAHHRECDHCRAQRDENPAVAGAGFYAAVYFDALRNSWPVLVRRLLPGAMLLTALSLLFGLAPIFAEEDILNTLEHTAPTYGWLFLLIHALMATSLLASPLPLRMQSRWAGAAARAALIGTLGYSLFALPAWPAVHFDDEGGLITLYVMVTMTVAPALVAPYTALVVHHGKGPLEAARLMVRAGLVPLCGGMIGSISLLGGLFSLLYPMFLVSVIAAAFVSWLGAFFILVSTVVSLVAFGLSMSLCATAGARVILDRAR